MRFKESVQYLLWKGIKDFMLIAIVAVISGVVLALILKPTGVEAQTYEPQTTEVQTPEVKEDGEGQNSDDLCADKKNFVSKALCQEANLQKVSTGDATSNSVETEGLKVGSVAGGISPWLLGVDSEDDNKESLSPYWQKIYASLPPVGKYGLAVMSVEATYTAMLYNPLVPSDTTAYYAYNFIPKPMRQEILGNDEVYAVSWTLGNPPDGENSFKYLNKAIGPIWLAMFKVATGIFVVVLVAAGIMIILRQKVGQNVVSVYMALKNIVIGYVGAFLSFGIGSFFFTFSKWLMIVFAALMKSITINGVDGDAIFLDGMVSGSFAYAWYAGKTWAKNLWAMLKSMWNDSIMSTNKGWIARVFDAEKQFLKLIIGGALGLVLAIGLAVAILWIFFKLFIKVIKIYVSMLIDIVLAPIFFLLGSIPGNEATISDWFKRMFKNSLKVPMIFLIVNLGFLFMSIGEKGLRAISGGALGVDGAGMFTSMGLYNIIPLTIISSANGIDKLIEQMFGGPSKTAGTITAGAQELLKGVPVIGGAMG